MKVSLYNFGILELFIVIKMIDYYMMMIYNCFLINYLYGLLNDHISD